MAKYSYEFKKRIVLEYLNNCGGYASLSHKYGITSTTQIRKWVAAYKQWGDIGLKRSRSQKIYSFEEKLSVVESYLSSELSYQKLALLVGINNPALIVRWVNEYKIAGPDALRLHKKGRKKTVRNLQKRKPDIEIQSANVDTSVDHVRELEDENLKLRLENAFLKELRRLRLEDEAKMRKLPKSSAVSEDHSN